MILAYTDYTGETRHISATVRYDTPFSSYGQPVIMLEDGQVVDYLTWRIMGYRLVSATEAERQAVAEMLTVFDVSDL